MVHMTRDAALWNPSKALKMGTAAAFLKCAPLSRRQTDTVTVCRERQCTWPYVVPRHEMPFISAQVVPFLYWALWY